jgi:phosphatidate cytidylyltransferase
MITAALLVAIVLFCVLLLPSWLSAVMLGVAWTLGAWEWGRFVEWSQGFVWVYAALFVLLALASGGLFDAAGAQQLALAAAFWWLLAFIGVTRFPWRIPAALVAAGGLMALLPSWLLLAYLHHLGSTGPMLALSVLCIVWAADVGAFFCGRIFGRAKLAPKVSPGKTWEGVLGGLLGATSVAALVGAGLGQPVLSWVVTGLATALASIVGDLTVSMCKRQAHMKDSGHLLPGHGGVLDRIDSLTSAVPIFFLSLSLAGLIA